MVGGIVIGLSRGPETTLVNVQERKGRNDVCAVRVIEKRVDSGEKIEIQVGDSIWWQCGHCMWTPKARAGQDDGKGCGKDWDIRIPKVGYSH